MPQCIASRCGNRYCKFQTFNFPPISKSANTLRLENVGDYNVSFFNSPDDKRTKIIFKDALFLSSLEEAKRFNLLLATQLSIKANLQFQLGEIRKKEEDAGKRIRFYEGLIAKQKLAPEAVFSIQDRIFVTLLDLEAIAKKLMEKPQLQDAGTAIQRAAGALSPTPVPITPSHLS